MATLNWRMTLSWGPTLPTMRWYLTGSAPAAALESGQAHCLLAVLLEKNVGWKTKTVRAYRRKSRMETANASKSNYDSNNHEQKLSSLSVSAYPTSSNMPKHTLAGKSFRFRHFLIDTM